MDSAKLQIPVNYPFSICNGTCPDSLRALPPDSVDSFITDPPYGLTDKTINIYEVISAFMNGKDFKPNGGGYNKNEWDSFVPGPQVWAEAYRSLKPGGWLISFSAKRTIHYLAMAVQMAGFEIKDQILWFHGQGASKTTPLAENLKEAGANEKLIELVGNYRADLRPLYEPILMAQKPMNSPNTAINIIKNSTGGMNAAEVLLNSYAGDIICDSNEFIKKFLSGKKNGIKIIPPVLSFSRTSQKEKKVGLQDFTVSGASDEIIRSSSHANQTPTNGYNYHPTVKPVALMKYLVELFSIEGAIIVDPFMGSGSTAIGALEANRRFIGVELKEDYFSLAQHRITKALKTGKIQSNSKANNIEKLRLDNQKIKLLQKLDQKISNNTATLDEFRKFEELLKIFGPNFLAA